MQQAVEYLRHQVSQYPEFRWRSEHPWPQRNRRGFASTGAKLMKCGLISHTGMICNHDVVSAERDGIPVCAIHERHPKWGFTLEQYAVFTLTRQKRSKAYGNVRHEG